MSEKLLKPAIRFKGFTEAWEQRKLSDIANYISSSFSIKDVVSDGKYDLYDANALIGKANGKPIPSDYISIIKDGAGVGRIRILPKNSLFIGTMGALISKENNLNFLYALLIKADLGTNFTGTTIPHIYFKDYGNDVHYIPSSDEQKVIGEYFARLDTLITLHQRKCDKLKNIKKSMLEKMFPKNNSKFPEIRFKGFTDAWEQRKVNEIADRYDNLRVPVTANLRIKGSTPYYGANGIQDYVDGYTHEGEFVLVAEDGANDLKNYPVKFVEGRIWVNNHAHVLQGKQNIADNNFLAFSINRADIESLLVGGGRSKLNAETMMNISLMIPEISEQIVIGRCISAIDTLITLHQRKLEKLKNLKKACLEKMFV